MKILTGNDLKTGDVLWWTGLDWSRHVADAATLDEHAESVLRKEEASRRVNMPYIIDAEPSTKGPRPAHIKDRIRAHGPTVRPDLTLKPVDPFIDNWTI